MSASQPNPAHDGSHADPDTATRAHEPRSDVPRGTSSPHTATNKPRKWRRRIFRTLMVLASATALTYAASCVRLHRDNPSFPATNAELADERSRMRAEPVELPRPVLVLSGYRSPAGSGFVLRNTLEDLTGPANNFHSLSYPLAGTIEAPAAKVIALVEKLYPSDDPAWTTEVDVVAISMGGLVARLAAADPELRGAAGGKRLKIGTLYTLGSPHRGATMADMIALDSAATNMKAGSEFLQMLDAELADAGFAIVPYAVLRDGMVGATNTAPPGQDPIWVPGRLVMSHLLIAFESRIKTDVALRLRGEEPMAAPSPAPRN